MSSSFSYVPSNYSHQSPLKKQVKIKDADLETIRQYLCPINNNKDPMMCLECKGREGCPPGQKAVDLLEQETKPTQKEQSGDNHMNKKKPTEKATAARTVKSRNKFYSAMMSKDPIKYLLNNGCPSEHAAKEFIRLSMIRYPDLMEEIVKKKPSVLQKGKEAPAVSQDKSILPSCSRELFTQALLSDDPTVFLARHFNVSWETAFEILTTEQRNYSIEVWRAANTREDPIGWYQRTFKTSSRQAAGNRIRLYRKKFEALENASFEEASHDSTTVEPLQPPYEEDNVSINDFIAECSSGTTETDKEALSGITCANDEALGSDESHAEYAAPLDAGILSTAMTTIDFLQKKKEICNRKSILEKQIAKCQEEIKKLDDIQKALDVLSSNNAYLKTLSKNIV